MSYFLQAIEHDMNMHAKFQDLILYICLQLIKSRFEFLEFYTMHYWENDDVDKCSR
jgi:hypothetical protein